MKKPENIYKTLTISIFIILFALSPLSLASQKPNIELGIDVLLNEKSNILKDKNIALFTNQSGVNKFGIPTAELLAKNEDINLKRIFVPEHGFFTTIPAGETVKNDELFGIEVISLYGPLKIPNSKILKDIDIVVVDIQDIGVRSYTYISSLLYLMQGCAEHNTKVVVLDRPNPLGGMIVDGNLPEEKFRSFVSLVPTTYIHGMTIGEIALMINGEKWTETGKQCELEIIKMKEWERWMAWEDTGLIWVPTSPHIPNPNAVRGIAMLGIFGELGILSVGIGTTSPFNYIGSPYIDFESLDIEYPGVYLQKTYFRPFYGMFSGKDVPGYYIRFDLSNEFKPYTTGILLLSKVFENNPDLLKEENIPKRGIEMFQKVTGTDEILKALKMGLPLEKLEITANEGLIEFLKKRSEYLLY